MMNQYARVGAKTIAADDALQGDRPLRRRRRYRRRGGGHASAASSLPMSGIIAPRRSPTTPSRCGWRWPASSSQYDRATHQGIWRWQSGAAHPPTRGQTMGIVSFGKIGQAIAAARQSIRRELLVYDPYHAGQRRCGPWRRRVTRTNFSPRSDIIMMQVPMTPKRGISWGRANSLLMKTGRHHRQYRARSDDRQQALSTRRCSPARSRAPGSTIRRKSRPSEPIGRRIDNPLFSLPNVIVTPHAAYYSEAVDPACARNRRQRSSPRADGPAPRNPVNNVGFSGDTSRARTDEGHDDAQDLQRIRATILISSRNSMQVAACYSASCVFAE